jgi:hypothetical protein
LETRGPSFFFALQLDEVFPIDDPRAMISNEMFRIAAVHTVPHTLHHNRRLRNSDLTRSQMLPS